MPSPKITHRTLKAEKPYGKLFLTESYIMKYYGNGGTDKIAINKLLKHFPQMKQHFRYIFIKLISSCCYLLLLKILEFQCKMTNHFQALVCFSIQLSQTFRCNFSLAHVIANLQDFLEYTFRIPSWQYVSTCYRKNGKSATKQTENKSAERFSVPTICVNTCPSVFYLQSNSYNNFHSLWYICSFFCSRESRQTMTREPII